MMRLFRTSKWESSIYAGLTTFVLMLLLYFGWVTLSDNHPSIDSWFSWTSVIVLGQIVISYRFGQRTQRKIDQLQVAMKQASAGNWDSRLPEVARDAFSGVYREFNVMLGQLKARLKLLQQMGERDVMEEVSSQEEAVLEERRRLARDLHDTVSQQLFALHMSASSLPKLLERDAVHAQKVMEQLIAMSSSAQRQMRGLIAQLRPMELQGKTLREALERWFPDYCRQNGLQGTLEIQIRGLISDAKEHQLFLIIQEAMANVVKHAEAQSVRLFLGETDRQISLSIEDNGLGFRGEQVRAGAYGLTTMRERAQKLGGEAEVVTKPGSGTHVRVWFPKFDDYER
jgi:NarL family two-component system sensor histidine kinase LiaS